MNDLQIMIMEEIENLEDMRLIDILGFIRYLKAEKTEKPEWIEQWFDDAAKSVREHAEEFEITPAQIEAQIKKD